MSPTARSTTSVSRSPPRRRVCRPASTSTTTSGRQCPQIHLPRLGGTRFGDPPPPLIHLGAAPLGHAPPLVVGIAVADGAVGRAGARRYQAGRKRRQGPHPSVGEELLQGNGRPPVAELRGVRFAHHGLPHRRLAPAARHRAVPRRVRALRADARPRRCRRRSFPACCQPGEAAVAHAGAVVVDGPGASLGPAHLPAQQPVPGGQNRIRVAGSHPASSSRPRSSIAARRAAAPSRTTPSSTCGNSPEAPAAGCGLASAAAVTGSPRSRSRGLGTASTAARSRDGSGWKYTCEEDTEACPSRSATTSMPPPASATLLANACRSWCGRIAGLQPGPARGRREQLPDRVRAYRRADRAAEQVHEHEVAVRARGTRIRSNS